MRRVVNFFLLTTFVGIASFAMLFDGEHPGRVILVLGGMVLLVVRGNAISDRSRTRRGKSPELFSTVTSSLENLSAMTRRDWQELGLTAVVATGLIVAGSLAFNGPASLAPSSAHRAGDLAQNAHPGNVARTVSAAIEIVGSGECYAEIKPEATLGTGDRCVLELMAQRCGSLDACFVNCWASGRGRNIGGGCTHLCNYSLMKPWSLPDGFDKCYARGEAGIWAGVAPAAKTK